MSAETMTDLVTAAQMRAIEAAAIDSGRVTGRDLMARAGRGLVAAVFGEWPDLAAAAHSAVVLCGPGNNGGDGFVVARLLADRGWSVEVLLYGQPHKLPPDARANHDLWDGALQEMTGTGLSGLDAPDLVVDALFGTGLRRPVEGVPAEAVATVAAWRGQGARVAAVDLPSGLCSDSGRPLAACVTADLSVSFHRAKPGHHLAEGPARCGRLAVVPIGLDDAAPGPAGSADRATLTGPVPALATKAGAGHKYAHGHALVLSGGPGRTGAARLAARAALRIGSGLVTLGVPPAAQQEAAAQLTAVMLARVGDGAALRDALADGRITALCLGPALGLAEDRRPLIEAALQSGRAAVLDADALGHLAADPTLFALLHDRCVLTPHGGEFARLFPDLAEKLAGAPEAGPAFSRVDAVRAAAARAACTVLLKGPDTVIASSDGTCAINSAAYDRAAPWLATAGAGDVLAGVITGLLARGFAPQPAAAAGAWLHTECARAVGPGLIAEDLPEQLPGVLRAL